MQRIECVRELRRGSCSALLALTINRRALFIGSTDGQSNSSLYHNVEKMRTVIFF